MSRETGRKKFHPNLSSHSSGKKKEPKPKLLGPEIFGWGGGLPHEGVGAKKFSMSLETREIKLFWRDIPRFCRDIPGSPKSLKKMFVFNSRPLIPRCTKQSSCTSATLGGGGVQPICFEGQGLAERVLASSFATRSGKVLL